MFENIVKYLKKGLKMFENIIKCFKKFKKV